MGQNIARKLSHLQTKRKSLIIIQIQEALWRKLRRLKPLLSHNEELYISEAVKENALASEGKSCRQETKTTENQYARQTSRHKISGKNHICSVKTFSSRI